MPATKNYFHDKIVLLLLSASFFMAFLGSALILLRLGNGGTSNYIVQYRSNLGISAYKTGGVADFLEFLLFILMILVIHLVLSIRTYRIDRQLAIVILSLGVLLLVVTTIVSTALLALR